MKKQRALVALGEARAAAELASLLTGAGAEVSVIDTGNREGMEKALRERPDIAFVELTPGIMANGRAAGVRFDEHDIPVIGIVPADWNCSPPDQAGPRLYGTLVLPVDPGNLKIILDLVARGHGAEKALRHSKDDLRKYRIHHEAVLLQRTKELKKTNAQIHRLLHYVEMTDRKLATDSLGTGLHREPEGTPPETGEGVITADPAMKVVLINPAASQILGWTEDQGVGKELGEIFAVSDMRAGSRILGGMKEMISAGSPGETLENVRVLTRSGELRALSAYYEPIFDSDDSIAGIVLTFRYVAENRRREYEAIRRKRLESLSLMARGLAHDLNNMLSSVLANIQLARVDLPGGTPGHDRLNSAEEAVFRARELSEQLLISSETRESPGKILDLAGLIRKTAIFSTRGSQSRVEFFFPEELGEVEIGEDIIRLILSDLFLFLDSSGPDGQLIAVTAENVPADEPGMPGPQGSLRISIDAPGFSVPEERRSYLFLPDCSPAFAVDLSFAESLVRKYGGALEVRKGDGPGTGFVLLLPARFIAPAPVRGGEPELLKTSEQSKKILLMDDEDAILSATSEMLKFLGYEVGTAHNGKAAVDMYRRAMTEGLPFDAVILDITVPGGLGAGETLPMLTEADPSVRAIISSGYSTNPMMTGYRSFGFVAAIVKPYGFRELQEALGQVFPLTK